KSNMLLKRIHRYTTTQYDHIADVVLHAYAAAHFVCEVISNFCRQHHICPRVTKARIQVGGNGSMNQLSIGFIAHVGILQTNDRRLPKTVLHPRIYRQSSLTEVRGNVKLMIAGNYPEGQLRPQPLGKGKTSFEITVCFA